MTTAWPLGRGAGVLVACALLAGTFPAGADEPAPTVARSQGKVRLVLSPDLQPDVALDIDGAPMSRESAAWSRTIGVGAHELHAQGSGHRTLTLHFTVDSASSMAVVFVPALPRAGRRLTAVGVVGGVTAGVGAVALASGAIFAASASGRDLAANGRCVGDRCTGEGLEARDQGLGWADLATVTAATGAALLVVGAILFVTGRSSDDGTSLAASAGP